MAFLISRDTFHQLVPEQEAVHLRAAARIAAVHAIANMGVQKIAVGPAAPYG